MMVVSVIVAVVVVLAVAAALYFALRPGAAKNGQCQPGSFPCPDAWTGAVSAARVCGRDRRWAPGGPGPGGCQVVCPAGQVACWDSSAGRGACLPGAACPCRTDGDCNAPHGTCTPDGCRCDPGYLRPDCKKEGPTCEDSMCGRGKCSPAGDACECDDGWYPPWRQGATGACSVCADGRGPPGDCRYWIIRDNVVLPLPTTPENCMNYDTHSNKTFDSMCASEFGTGSTFAKYCSVASHNNACRSADADPTCHNVGSFNTNQLACHVPKGYYSTHQAAGPYDACNIGPGCVAALPSGYVHAVR